MAKKYKVVVINKYLEQKRYAKYVRNYRLYKSESIRFAKEPGKRTISKEIYNVAVATLQRFSPENKKFYTKLNRQIRINKRNRQISSANKLLYRIAGVADKVANHDIKSLKRFEKLKLKVAKRELKALNFKSESRRKKELQRIKWVKFNLLNKSRYEYRKKQALERYYNKKLESHLNKKFPLTIESIREGGKNANRSAQFQAMFGTLTKKWNGSMKDAFEEANEMIDSDNFDYEKFRREYVG